MSEHINSLIKGMQVLELFSRETKYLGITDIKQQTGFPVSTVHRIVSTLEHCGYLRQDVFSNKYALGIKAYILGTNVEYIKELKHVATEPMRALSVQFNEVVHLAIIDSDMILCIKKVDSSRSITTTPKEGELNEIYLTSVGKSLLANQSKDYINHYVNNVKLTKYTDNTITDPLLLLKELDKIRLSGYAIDDEESEIGLTCFGAPIFNNNKECVAAISMSMPTFRVEDKEHYCNAVVRAAKEISLKL